MPPEMHRLRISAVQADALFASALQRYEHPSAEQVRQAVTAAVCVFGEHGCAERVAQEFGDHPETAGPRMQWARQLAGEAFADRALGPSEGTSRARLATVSASWDDPHRWGIGQGVGFPSWLI